MAKAQDPWPGLTTDVSPHAAGARVSENCRALRVGIMQARGGVREVYCENMTARGAVVTDITTLPNVIAISTLRRAEGDYLVFLDSNGALMAGRRPT